MTEENRVGAYRVVKQVWTDEGRWQTTKLLRGPIMPEDKQQDAIEGMFDDI